MKAVTLQHLIFFPMHINSFLEYLQHERRYSKHTLLAYKTDLKQFEEFLKNAFEIEDLNKTTAAQIRSWIVLLLENKTTPRSVNRKLSSLKSFFKYLLQEELISKSPLLKISILKTPKKLPVFLEEQSTAKLFSGEYFSNDFAGERDKLILEILYSTGIRLSELINLSENNIDFQRGTIKVLGKRNKERIIPVSQALANTLYSYINSKSKVFKSMDHNFLMVSDKGEKLYPKFVYQKVNYYLGFISTASKKSPHVLRHTFATHMLNHGADLNAIKELLGHSSLSATQVYTHNTIQKLKDIHKRSHPKGE